MLYKSVKDLLKLLKTYNIIAPTILRAYEEGAILLIIEVIEPYILEIVGLALIDKSRG